MSKVRCNLLILFVLTVQSTSICQVVSVDRERLAKDEYGAVALVARAELIALGPQAIRPVCIGITQFRIAPQPLIEYLRREGIEISDRSACFPSHGYPRGLMISIEKFERESDGVRSIWVESIDERLGPDTHFASRLRSGTYRVEKSGTKQWRVSEYVRND